MYFASPKLLTEVMGGLQYSRSNVVIVMYCCQFKKSIKQSHNIHLEHYLSVQDIPEGNFLTTLTPNSLGHRFSGSLEPCPLIQNLVAQHCNLKCHFSCLGKRPVSILHCWSMFTLSTVGDLEYRNVLFGTRAGSAFLSQPFKEPFVVSSTWFLLLVLFPYYLFIWKEAQRVVCALLFMPHINHLP